MCAHLEGSYTAGSMQRFFGLSGTACGSLARLCRTSRKAIMFWGLVYPTGHAPQAHEHLSRTEAC